MAYAMTKRGSLDNCVTYEFICDTIEDMNAIENRYRTIGSIAIVLQGDNGLEVYISGSDKQWNSLSSIGGSSGAGAGGAAGLAIHICGQNEVSEGLPNVSEPDETTIYLVPAEDEESGNLYDEYIYVDNDWEKFGSNETTIDLSAYATIASPVFTGSISLGRKANTTAGENSVAEGSEVTASGNNSHAEGAGTTASGYQSHAEGVGAQATGNGSHAEGGGTHATGSQSHAEGGGTTASGANSHAEGVGTTASGSGAHAEGGGTQATSTNAHAEGQNTVASSSCAHAEGRGTIASGNASHAEGEGVTALGYCEHALGRYNELDTANTWTAGSSYIVNALVKREESYVDGSGITRTVTKIYRCKKSNSDSTFNSSKWEEYGQYLFVVGNGSANNSRSNAFSIGWSGNTAEGAGTVASGSQSHAEGSNTQANGTSSHAEGNSTIASGSNSHAEGIGGTYTLNSVQYTSEAKGTADHVEGYQCLTNSGQPGNHAEGYQTRATGGASHSEGAHTIASGAYAHAEGSATTASGAFSHSEGSDTVASGNYSHVEGYYATGSGYYAHAEGQYTIASGSWAHVEGRYTIASGDHSHVGGKFNIDDALSNWMANTEYKIGDRITFGTNQNYICKTAHTSGSTFSYQYWSSIYGEKNYAVIIGNGTATDSRSNAYALDWDGNEHLMGDIYVGCNADSTGGVKLPRIPEPPTTDGTYILKAVVSNGVPTYSWVTMPESASGVNF